MIFSCDELVALKCYSSSSMDAKIKKEIPLI